MKPYGHWLPTVIVTCQNCGTNCRVVDRTGADMWWADTYWRNTCCGHIVHRSKIAPSILLEEGA